MDDYTRFVTVLVAFSESDFRSDAVQLDPITGEAKSFGCFQQKPAFWPTARGTTTEQCMAFLANFAQNRRHHNGDPVHDAWITQRWGIPGAVWPDTGPLFSEQKVTPRTSTENYFRRVPLVPAIIRDRRLP